MSRWTIVGGVLVSVAGIATAAATLHARDSRGDAPLAVQRLLYLRSPATAKRERA